MLRIGQRSLRLDFLAVEGDKPDRPARADGALLHDTGQLQYHCHTRGVVGCSRQACATWIVAYAIVVRTDDQRHASEGRIGADDLADDLLSSGSQALGRNMCVQALAL